MRNFCAFSQKRQQTDANPSQRCNATVAERLYATD